MDKKLWIYMAVMTVVCVALFFVVRNQFKTQQANLPEAPQGVQTWGSFTNADVTSSDGKYLARHSAQWLDNNVYEQMILVEIYDAATDELVDSFSPAPARDFWGVCWAEGTHDLWTQSGDAGVQCYSEKNGKWSLNKGAPRPEDVVSKWFAEMNEEKQK